MRGELDVPACIYYQEMAAMLYRYAQYKGYDVSIGEDTNILSYPDAFDVSEYAIPAVPRLPPSSCASWRCKTKSSSSAERAGGKSLRPLRYVSRYGRRLI